MSVWSKILKPQGKIVKWLIFFTLLAFLYFNASDRLAPLRNFLNHENLTFGLGDYQVTAYQILNVVLTVAMLIWISALIAELAVKQVGRLGSHLRASNQALLVKFAQIGTYVVAGLIGLDLIGVDLTTLTVFSGALGIGLGFGLQKIASNFISGLIMLMEKSIEVGDLVELADGTYGFIRHTGARFTLMETFDGKEILIPNEDFITNRVTNWTYSNHKGRVEIAIGVAYGSDLQKVRDILIESASQHPRCAKDPQPNCFLRGFGDSSIDFLLHFWVDDVENGRWTPQSEVMFTVWNRFAEEGVTIPFPQRDLHIRSGLPQAETGENPAGDQASSE